MEPIHWPEHPLILELNTWTWLHDLSTQYGEPVTLANLPEEALAAATQYVDALWLMGVWQRSPKAREIAVHRPELQETYRNALADFTETDVVGSPYAVYDYVVDPSLGGMAGLQAVREALRQRGKLLILDFVPNHLAIDHPLITEHPEFFLQGSQYDLTTNPQGFFQRGHTIFAHGKDPYFPSWPDTIQLNAFSESYRLYALDTLRRIASSCDGVRCDMAMLLVDRIFRQTWGERGGYGLRHEFWPDIITQVKQTYPECKFLAEVYWDMEWELQQQGFDFCYDKRLYDRLLYENTASIKAHLQAEWEYQSRLIRFVENHDESRAASAFGVKRSLAAAAIVLTLPGARLMYDGQPVGKRIKCPIELGRCEHEALEPEVHALYQRLLPAIASTCYDDRSWHLCHIEGQDFWQSPFISYVWELEQALLLVVVNYSDQSQTGQINLTEFGSSIRAITELMHQHPVSLDENPSALMIQAEPWDVQIFRIER